jgi:ABC-type transporter MlaC component
MKSIVLLLVLLGAWGCDSKSETVKQGRQAVKEVVNQPFDALNSAKESLQKSEEKQKAALDEAEKELQQPAP